MSQLELQSKQDFKQREAKVASTTPSARNLSLPPFTAPDNEPYGDNQLLKFGSQFQSEQVIEKLNEFADSTIQFGEQLLKRLLQTEQELQLNSDELIEYSENTEENKEDQIGTFYQKPTKDNSTLNAKVSQIGKSTVLGAQMIGKSIWNYFQSPSTAGQKKE